MDRTSQTEESATKKLQNQLEEAKHIITTLQRENFALRESSNKLQGIKISHISVPHL